MAIERLFAGLVVLATMAAAPAQAGWREDIGVFRIGIVVPGGGGAVPGDEAIRAGFSAALGMPVELFAAKDYAVLVDAQATGRIQYAVHTATSYAAAALLCSCIVPIAAPVGEDGGFGIRSVLIARADGPATAEAAAKARIAFGPADSVTGALLPRAEWRPGGADLTGTEGFLVPVASAEEAERKLVDGEVDAMFGFVRSTDDPSSATGGTPQRLRAAGLDGTRILWTSPLLRNGPHAVQSTLPAEAKDILSAYLLGLREANPDLYDLVEPRFSGGFAAVSAEDYGSALSLARKLSGASPAE